MKHLIIIFVFALFACCATRSRTSYTKETKTTIIYEKDSSNVFKSNLAALKKERENKKKRPSNHN